MIPVEPRYRPWRAALALIGLIAASAAIDTACARTSVDPTKAQANNGKEPTDLVFAFWNVENLFDDREDKRNRTDEPFDEAFAKNPELRKLKYTHLATALLRINGGKGPDILACVEVETPRAGELLMEVLNAQIKEEHLKYKSMAMKNLDAGRHISPCVISRLPLSQISTKLHGNMLRVLETHLIVNDHDLTILATHWTSKIRKDDGSDGESGRRHYGSTIADVYTGILKKHPDADVLVCGDFNDTPESEPVTKALRAVGDREAVKKSLGSEKPLLLDLMAGKETAKFGTIWYNNEPRIYDHICVSPGLLDEIGWTCAPASLQTFTQGLIRPGGTRRQPWRFSDPNRHIKPEERGFSDHFPVVVKLSVAP